GSFTITVQDTTPPGLSSVASQTLEDTRPAGAARSFRAHATDMVDGSDTVSFSIPSGSTFALGVNTVHYSATDAAGNTSSGSFTITVEDTTPPVLSSVASQTLEATSPAGAAASFLATATDIVDGSDTVSFSIASGS